MLRCPATGRGLRQVGDCLVTDDGSRSYAITASGIPLFGTAGLSAEARTQQSHYEQLAPAYVRNLGEEHTRQYMEYLDRKLIALIGEQRLKSVAEICCGAGEAFEILGTKPALGIGVDVSTAMLEHARKAIPGSHRLFVQGDAVNLPLADAQFDAVFMLGGIHHVNDRVRLFSEIRRILRPDGCFYWREPVDDFAPWRLARSLIYRWASALEEGTEHPLRYRQTIAEMGAAGFRITQWHTLGFLGYCFLMNSDVLAVNRVWARVPFIRTLTRAAAALDDAVLKLPMFGRSGALVIGSAVRTSG